MIQPENLLKTIEIAAQLKANLKLDQKQVQDLYRYIQDLQTAALSLTAKIQKDQGVVQ